MSEGPPLRAWLKQRRRLLDLTQAQLGDLARCSEVMVQKLESGQRRPSAALALSLARALRVPDREARAFVQFARSDELDASVRLPGWNPEPTSDWRWPEASQSRSEGTNAELPFGLMLTYDLVTSGVSRRDTLPDGRELVALVGTGPVGGDLDGTIEVHLHQVTEPGQRGAQQAAPTQLAARFDVTVGDESIGGVYTGTMTPAIDADGSGVALAEASGQIVAVTAGFADHFLDHVLVADEVRVQEGIGRGALGTMRVRRPG